MPTTLMRNTILLQSFKNAARSTTFKRDVMKIPAAVNSTDETVSNDTIFRTTDK